MNKNIYKILGAAALGISGAYFLSFNKVYEPRSSSNLKKVEQGKSEYEESIVGVIDEINQLRVNQITGKVDFKDVVEARNATLKAQTRRVAKDLKWEELGPDNVGGRTRAIVIDRNDPSIMYMGAVSGGIWKSTTRGTSWKKIGDDLANINVVSITQAANGDIYYGTGEGGFVAVRGDKNGTPGFEGDGIFKSTDAGASFTRLTSTASSLWENVHKMASDPSDPDRIYACNNGGFFVSTNGGQSWTKPAGQVGVSKDVQVADNGHVYIYIGNSIYKSTDKGNSLTKTGFNTSGTSPTYSVGRLTIAISPQDANYVYTLIADNAGKLEGLSRTTNGGDNWETLVEGGPVYAEIFGTGNGQGEYDNIITVDPSNKNRVFMGGVGLAEWDNVRGYTLIASTFASRINPSYVHADKHEMIWDRTANPPILWIGTDGGLYRSANMNNSSYNYTFSEQNRGYITTQYYGVAAAEDGTVMGGTQDNGTQLINGSGNTPQSAVRVFGGDGFQAEIARKDPGVIFAESQYGAMQRSTNGAVSFSPIWDARIGNANLEITSPGPGFAPFDCQFRLWEHPTDSSKSKFVFAPYNRLWVATNPVDLNNRPNWFVISTGFGFARITSLDISENGDNVFYSTATGGLYRVDSLTYAVFDTAIVQGAFQIPDRINTVNIRGNLSSGRAITSISIDPSNPNRALVTLGNYGNSDFIYVSNNVLDANPTWTNVTGNLPRMPVYHGLILIDNPNFFIVATEMGMWASDDNGSTWELQHDGMPATVASYTVRQYEFKPWEGPRVYTATHGRGFFKTGTFLTDIKRPKASIGTTSIKLFPNPTSDYMTVSFEASSAGDVDYVLYSLTGKQVLKITEVVNAGEVSKTIHVKGIAKGTYILSVGNGNQRKATKVLVN